MYYLYINFLTNKIKFLNTLEYILLALLFFLLCFLILSLIFNILIKKNNNLLINQLLKQEKLLLNLTNSYKNGQINAIEYKKRISNLTKKVINDQ